MANIEYPKPRSKRWAHWSASMYPNVGNYQWHLDWMVRAGFGGIKLLSDGNAEKGQGDSGLGFAIEVQNRGMIAVPRYYMPADHNWTDANDYATESYVKNGIVIIETINEPDLNYEWSDGHLPSDWAQRAFENWITMAQRIIALGGIPVSPSMASGFMQARDDNAGQLTFNPFEMVKAAGIEKFVCGIHNYSLNHPILYPYDPVNQEGQPLTREEYDAAGGDWAWDRPGNRSVEDHIAEINQWRESDKNPGDTIMEDDAAFLAVEIFRAMLDKAGYPDVPVLTTEGGPCLTDRQDRRYARTTPQLMQQMVEAELAYMASRPWYLGYAWWLWGNYSVGGTGGWMTNQWFWPGGPFSDSDGFIPIVKWLINRPVSEDGNTDTPEPPPDNGGEEPPVIEPQPEPTLQWLIPDWNNAKLERYPAVEGQIIWRLVKAELSPDNMANTVWINVLDENGQRTTATVKVLNANGVEETLPDKIGEPYNRPIWKQDNLAVFITNDYGSDTVSNIHTEYWNIPDVNTFHIGYILTFQKWIVPDESAEPPPVEPPPPPETPPTDEEIREFAWTESGLPYNPTFAIQAYAHKHNLGKPLYEEQDWRGHRLQFYALGIVFAPIDEWAKTRHITW